MKAKMKTQITEQDLIDWRACYWANKDEDKIRRLRKLLPCTPEQLLRKRSVSHGDKIWVLTRNDFFSDQELRLIACDFSESVLHIFEHEFPGDKRVKNCINTARLFANDKVPIQILNSAYAEVIQIQSEENITHSARYCIDAAKATTLNHDWYCARQSSEYSIIAAMLFGENIIKERKKQVKIIEKYLKKKG